MPSLTGASTVDHLPDPSGHSPLGGDRASTGRLGDRLFGGAATGAGLLVIAIVTLIAVFLLSQAVPALRRDGANFLTSTEWNVAGDHPRFGIATLLWTTVASSVVAMVIAVPLGVGVALFVTQYAPRWLSRPAASLVDLLAAVPSIVYGLWGAYVFGPHITGLQSGLSSVLGWIPFFSNSTGGVDSSGTIFFIGIVLSIMVLPIVTALSREVFAQTPATHKEAALALGATRWEMIRTAVLPFGRPGLISASMLGLGRALGETVAVLFIINVVRGDFSWSVFTGGETFASRIARDAGEFDTPEKTGAYIAAGLLLFVLTFAVNAVARVVIERRKAFTE